ncbi:hypothetical protein ABBQ38_006792 [Trebouxia sp. C0009 RCD-2024]
MLEGPIPDTLGLLSKLRYLNLANNSLSSSIPHSIWRLQNLGHLILSQNQLSGSLPGTTDVPKLSVLDVSRNQLTGALPLWPAAEDLSIMLYNHNRFAGTIPAPPPANQLGTKHVAFEMAMNDNLLTGTIPAELQYLPLRNLDLSRNQLTGDVSVLGAMPFLARARLSGNLLTGTLPTIVASSLLRLDLQYNMLTGTFPAALLSSNDLAELRVSGNNLSGALPSLRAPSLTSLYIMASGLGPPVGGGPFGENLPSFLSFDRRHRRWPVPDSNFSCWKVVANSALAPHLDFIDYDASLFGCQACACVPSALCMLHLQTALLRFVK